MATITIMKAMIGAGLLVLPKAFSEVHLALAIPGLVLTAVLVALGTVRLIQCKVQISGQISVEKKVGESDDLEEESPSLGGGAQPQCGGEYGALSTRGAGRVKRARSVFLYKGGIAATKEEDFSDGSQLDDCGLGPMGVISNQVLGKAGLWFTAVVAMLCQFGIGVVYTNFIILTLEKIMHDAIPVFWMRLGLTCLLCLMSLVKGLGGLAWLSALALLVYVYILVALTRVGVHNMRGGLVPPIHDTIMPLQWSGMGKYLGTCISAFEGIVVAQYVYDDMKVSSPRPFINVIWASYSISFVIYGFFGAFGYSIYGSAVEDIIYQNFPEGTLDVTICKSVLCIVLVITFVLQYYAIFHVLEKKFGIGDRSRGGSGENDSGDGDEKRATPLTRQLMSAILRFSVVIASAVVAAFVPGVNKMLDYVGGFGFSYIGLILPAVIHMKLNPNQSVLNWVGDLLLTFTGLASMVLTLLA